MWQMTCGFMWCSLIAAAQRDRGRGVRAPVLGMRAHVDLGFLANADLVHHIWEVANVLKKKS
jgi:hypothetical protein